ncbi:hypothetical protein J6W78_10525 [bacterium]|nr:hypothetical protein [bacterium]
MWRQATSTPQKLAVINGLLPLTASEFLKALIFFCGDEDEAVQKAAIEKLRFTQSNEIKKIISPEIPENSVRTLTKLAGERRDSSIIISLLMTGKLQRNWVLEFLATNDRTFWTTLVTHKDFVEFTLPQKEDFKSLLSAISDVLISLYEEQLSYFAEKIAEMEAAEQEYKLDETQTEEGEEEEKDENVVELEDTIFDFPDFLTSETAFDGLSADDMLEQRKTIAEALRDMNVGQKIKVAMLGNLEVRKILIKDPRKQIVMAVLGNARITDKEVASIAGDPSSSLDAISYIASNKALSKSYAVKLALVNNPKTPMKTALMLLETIRMNDLKNIAKSRNVSNVIKQRAAKKIK